MVKEAHARAALKGVRVLELTDAIGQFAGKLMADMGADVIKIEPVGGSDIRQLGPFARDTPDVNGSLTFWHYNTSKRGMTLNLESEEGKAIFRDLAKTADVVIESFRPGYMASLGLGYEELSRDNEKLVYCAITHFGQDGPWRDYEAGDLVHLALGGTMASSGYDTVEGAPPIAPTGGNAYHTASHLASSGIMVGLLHAAKTGEGQFIDVAVHDATSVTTELAVPLYVYDDKIVQRYTGRHAAITASAPLNFPTADGHMLSTLLNTSSLARWEKLFEWMAETGDAGDLVGKYATLAAVSLDIAHVTEVVGRFVGKNDLDYLYHGGQKLKFAWTPIRAVDDLRGDPHLTDRGMFHQVEYPERGETYTHLGGPYQFAASKWEIRGRAPLLGEHNEDILVGELGLDRARLSELSKAGVL